MNSDTDMLSSTDYQLLEIECENDKPPGHRYQKIVKVKNTYVFSTECVPSYILFFLVVFIF